MSPVIKIIFTISVILNLVLIGAGVGVAHKFMDHSPLLKKDVRKEMSPEARRAMFQNFREARSDFRPLLEEARAQGKTIRSILEAETFDEEAYDEAAATLMEIQSKIAKEKAERMKQIMLDLPAEDRQKIAPHLSKRMSQGHFKDRRKHKSNP